MRRLSLLVLFVSSPLFAAFSGTDVFVGSVGRGPGAAGSDWYTSVWIHNPGAAPATVTAYLLLRNQTNPTPATQTVVVQPGETRRIDNIVETLFGQTNSFGALRFTSASKIVVNARIFNKPAGGADSDSSGQNFDGIPSAFAIGAGQSTIVLGVHQTDPLGTSLFRYNYGYVETAGGSGTVRVTAADSTGTTLGSKDYSVGPYEARQFGIVDILPSVNSTNIRLTVSVQSGTAKVIAFGSGIANRSNDPTTFDMSFRDELLAGPAAPTSVAHDATLTGDGSAGAPLGIAGAGSAASGKVLTANGSGGVAWQPVPGFALPFVGDAAPLPSGVVFQVTNDSTDTNKWTIGATSHGGASGLLAFADDGDAVTAQANGSGVGVRAVGSNGAIGLLALGNLREAINAGSTKGRGVVATSGADNAVYAASTTKEAVKAISEQSHGVWGEAHANDFYGVVAINTVGNHPALLGTLGFAGDFVGDVRVKGALVKLGGGFTIDHPLDPEHKTLTHSFVESPDRKNIYDGVVTTDRDGLAVVELPEWFEALNRDFRYQLTVIGVFAQAIIDTEIANNRFTIRTDRPNVKVSWQVTGIRHDPWANAHRIEVEKAKPPEEQGLYLAPEVYGKPLERDSFWAKHPELIRK